MSSWEESSNQFLIMQSDYRIPTKDLLVMISICKKQEKCYSFFNKNKSFSEYFLGESNYMKYNFFLIIFLLSCISFVQVQGEAYEDDYIMRGFQRWLEALETEAATHAHAHAELAEMLKRGENVQDLSWSDHRRMLLSSPGYHSFWQAVAESKTNYRERLEEWLLHPAVGREHKSIIESIMADIIQRCSIQEGCQHDSNMNLSLEEHHTRRAARLQLQTKCYSDFLRIMKEDPEFFKKKCEIKSKSEHQ